MWLRRRKCTHSLYPLHITEVTVLLNSNKLCDLFLTFTSFNTMYEVLFHTEGQLVLMETPDTLQNCFYTWRSEFNIFITSRNL